VVGTVWFVKMPRITIAELQLENEKLRAEIRDLRSRLQQMADAILSALDTANASVARHIRMMQMVHDEQQTDEL
jgi:hypothetical protein